MIIKINKVLNSYDKHLQKTSDINDLLKRLEACTNLKKSDIEYLETSKNLIKKEKNNWVISIVLNIQRFYNKIYSLLKE